MDLEQQLFPRDAIAKIAANDKELKVVNLNNNPSMKLNPDGFCVEIAEALKTNDAVEELLLAGCDLTDVSAKALGEMLAVNKTLIKLDLERNKITNDGCNTIAHGLKSNKTLKELNLLNQPHQFGEGCLDEFLKTFEHNTALTKLTWRLNSRQSFRLNSKITRNKDIERLLKAGRPVDHLDPNILRENAQGAVVADQ